MKSQNRALDKGSTTGYKEDLGKPEWDLLPYDALLPVVKVFTSGAKKYTRHNWRSGMLWSRPMGAILRHITAWWEGEDLDSDSGEHHLAHVIAEALFLMYYTTHKRYNKHDNRYKGEINHD